MFAADLLDAVGCRVDRPRLSGASHGCMIQQGSGDFGDRVRRLGLCCTGCPVAGLMLPALMFVSICV